MFGSVCLSVYFSRVSGNQMRLLTPTLYRSQMAGARQSLSMDCSGEETQTGEWERTNRNQYTNLCQTFTLFENPDNTLIFLISVYMWKKLSLWHKLKGTEFLQQLLFLNLHICATWCSRPMIFLTMNYVRSNNLSLKHQRFTSSDWDQKI